MSGATRPSGSYLLKLIFDEMGRKIAKKMRYFGKNITLGRPLGPCYEIEGSNFVPKDKRGVLILYARKYKKIMKDGSWNFLKIRILKRTIKVARDVKRFKLR